MAYWFDAYPLPLVAFFVSLDADDAAAREGMASRAAKDSACQV